MQPTKEQILLAAKRALLKKSFYHFFLEFWDETSPEVLVDNWHIKVLCDEVQRMGERIKDRLPKEYDLIINVPPASSKSTIVSVLFPCWLWVIDPTIKVLTGSYGTSLSLQHSVKSRTVINSPKFKELFPEIKLKEDNNNKQIYENTSMGVRVASSVGTGVIGSHFHCLIVDDPINASPTENEIETANEWMNTKLSTRKIDKAITPTILIMQRLSEDDCTANMKAKSKNVRHILLPAELSEKTTKEYIKFYKNGLFDPVRLPPSVLAESKTELGTKGYACQYDQDPTPKEGIILKKHWFSSTVLSPEDFSKITWDMFIDSAYTEKQENDPSAIIICGLLNNNLYIRKSFQYWEEFPTLIQTIIKLNAEYNIRKIHIETKASGLSIIQTLRKQTKLNIVELPAKDSKTTRVNAISPLVEAKRIILLKDDWNEQFIDECCGFPLARYDDQLDCMVYAINQLLQKKSNLSYATM